MIDHLKAAFHQANFIILINYISCVDLIDLYSWKETPRINIFLAQDLRETQEEKTNGDTSTLLSG